MLIAGLVLSVVGILLVPFVIVVVPFLLLVAVVGGFLAVAHAMGETHIRRRMAAGVMVGSANSYRYLRVGLGAIAGVARVDRLRLGTRGGTLISSRRSWPPGTATAGLVPFCFAPGSSRPARPVVPPDPDRRVPLATPQFGFSAVNA